MKVQTTTSVVTTLVLSQEETAWLHAVMQNPLCGPNDIELHEDAEMRRKFFEATTPTI